MSLIEISIATMWNSLIGPGGRDLEECTSDMKQLWANLRGDRRDERRRRTTRNIENQSRETGRYEYWDWECMYFFKGVGRENRNNSRLISGNFEDETIYSRKLSHRIFRRWETGTRVTVLWDEMELFIWNF